MFLRDVHQVESGTYDEIAKCRLFERELLKPKSRLDPLEPVNLWKRKCMLHKKFIFHWNNLVVVPFFIYDDFRHNIWIDLPIPISAISLIGI